MSGREQYERMTSPTGRAESIRPAPTLSLFASKPSVPPTGDLHAPPGAATARTEGVTGDVIASQMAGVGSHAEITERLRKSAEASDARRRATQDFSTVQTQGAAGNTQLRESWPELGPGSIRMKRPGRPVLTEKDVMSGSTGEVRRLLDTVGSSSEDAAKAQIAALKPLLEQAWTGLASRIVQMTMSEVIRNLEFEAARN